MPKKFSQKQLIMIGGGAFLAIVAGIFIYMGLRPKANTGAAVTLNVWGTEAQMAFGAIASGYPYATVKYTQIDPAGYESKLLSALAAGTGPDVFEIGNRELPKLANVLAPLPTSTQAFGPLQLSQLFPDVVGQDFVLGGQIYGLPLSIDTLAMVYNKDLFNSAGIALPPATWNDFDADVTKLRALAAAGQLSAAGAAIGGSSASIPNATDILSLLMLQNGTRMTNANNAAATFASQSGGGTGIAAFNFYLQFANPASPYYTWNDSMGNAIDAFVGGKTAIIFAYQSDLAAIKAKAPFFNFGVAPMPQAQGATIAVNYPKYNGFVVAKAGQQAAAWNFVLYLAALSGAERSYLSATGKPPATRADIAADMNDPNLAVFAKQALTAKSWYEVDDAKVDDALNGAIVNVQNNGEDPAKALKEAETAISQLMSY